MSATLTNGGNSPLKIASVTLKGKPFAMQTTCGKVVAPGGNCSITATYKPQMQGQGSGTVSIVDSASSKPMVVELIGTGTVVGFTPDKVAFGFQKVGSTSAPQVIKVTNTGLKPLAFTYFIYVGGSDYSDFSETNNCPSALNSGASCSINVVFKPRKTGTRSALVYVTDSGGGSPQTVPISGTGD